MCVGNVLESLRGIQPICTCAKTSTRTRTPSRSLPQSAMLPTTTTTKNAPHASVGAHPPTSTSSSESSSPHVATTLPGNGVRHRSSMCGKMRARGRPTPGAFNLHREVPSALWLSQGSSESLPFHEFLADLFSPMLPPIVFSVPKPKNSGKQRATPAEETPESTGPTAPLVLMRRLLAALLAAAAASALAAREAKAACAALPLLSC